MKKTYRILFCVVSAIIIIPLFFYNYHNNNEFWEASFSSILSITIGIILSFFIVQRQTDKRIQKEIFIKLLDSLLILIGEDKLSICQKMSSQEILLWKRNINNKVTLIGKYEKTFSISKHIKRLKEANEECINVIDLFISKSKKANKEDLQRATSLINQIVFDIMVDLYN